MNSTQFNKTFQTPVLTAGSSFILGYTDESHGIYSANKDNPVMIFDDFTTSFHWVDFDFKVKSSAMKILKPKENCNVDFRFVYYAIKCINYSPSSHSRQWISKYSNHKIYIPSLAKQKGIVATLDKFHSLINDLSDGIPAEQKARRKQYEYYRNKLLTF